MSLFDALNIAQSGMSAAAQRLEATAAAVAGSSGANEPQVRPENVSTAPGVLVRYLPLPGGSTDITEQLTSLVEDRLAFEANALVFKTAAEMIRTLYDAVDSANNERHDRYYFG